MTFIRDPECRWGFAENWKLPNLTTIKEWLGQLTVKEDIYIGFQSNEEIDHQLEENH